MKEKEEEKRKGKERKKGKKVDLVFGGYLSQRSLTAEKEVRERES